jgi:hypothetical protein
MREWWVTRWYTPILALGALLLVLLIAGLAVMEVLVADPSSSGGFHP